MFGVMVMNKRYFTNIVGDLQLIMEYVFIEYERPILFCAKKNRVKKNFCASAMSAGRFRNGF